MHKSYHAAFKCIVSRRHYNRSETLCTYMVMTINICLSSVMWRKRDVILHLNISSPLNNSLNRIEFMFRYMSLYGHEFNNSRNIVADVNFFVCSLTFTDKA